MKHIPLNRRFVKDKKGRRKKRTPSSSRLFKIIIIILAAVILLILTVNYAADIRKNERKENEQNSAQLSLSSFSTDKEIYHSAEIMNMSFDIYSSAYAGNVNISIRGINEKLDIQDSIYLKNGFNKIFFQYQLPRCNVCGGISAGNYSIDYEIAYKSSVIKGSKIVEIRQ